MFPVLISGVFRERVYGGHIELRFNSNSEIPLYCPCFANLRQNLYERYKNTASTNFTHSDLFLASLGITPIFPSPKIWQGENRSGHGRRKEWVGAVTNDVRLQLQYLTVLITPWLLDTIRVYAETPSDEGKSGSDLHLLPSYLEKQKRGGVQATARASITAVQLTRGMGCALLACLHRRWMPCVCRSH